MGSSIIKKLRSRAGESIAETLIAVLVIAVASVLLAGMIAATNNIVRQSRVRMEAYYEKNVALETFPDAGAGSAEPGIKITATARQNDGSLNNNIYNNIYFSIPDVSVVYAENRVFARDPVIAYRVSGN